MAKPYDEVFRKGYRHVVTGLKAAVKKRRSSKRDSAQGLVGDRMQLARRLGGLNELIGRILDHGGYFEEFVHEFVWVVGEVDSQGC